MVEPLLDVRFDPGMSAVTAARFARPRCGARPCRRAEALPGLARFFRERWVPFRRTPSGARPTSPPGATRPMRGPGSSCAGFALRDPRSTPCERLPRRRMTGRRRRNGSGGARRRRGQAAVERLIAPVAGRSRPTRSIRPRTPRRAMPSRSSGRVSGPRATNAARTRSRSSDWTTRSWWTSRLLRSGAPISSHSSARSPAAGSRG